MHNLAKIKKITNQIIALSPIYKTMSDAELKHQTEVFIERYKAGISLEKMLPEAFAVVREASFRVLGMEHYPVQLMGGIALFNGSVAEMKTGEGKTLVATCPAYLAALSGSGVHIVTTNDYLAQRDSEQMGKVFEFLGLTTGCVLQNMDNETRRAMYACDITYVTNTEVAFDYLRDNLTASIDERVLRGLNFAIIDEIDSILIDEARTPLIISGKGTASQFALYKKCDELARLMKSKEETDDISFEDNIDFITNPKSKTLFLTDKGTKKAEEFFNIENLADIEHTNIQHALFNALRAHSFMFKNKDYIIKDGEILIIDEFTGRIANGRKWSDGLHQALEAKEDVEMHTENKTLASITFQAFFNHYNKKSGMSGTAYIEKREFKEVYNLDIVIIPTNKPVIRIDETDVLFKTKEAKINAIVDEVIEVHKTGRPILIGTLSIEDSELIARRLRRHDIRNIVLNAKYHAKEAEIVSRAGEVGAITIATNMAGRGTDIKLSKEAKEKGGLYIIGAERADSRRIDDQLRGRAGRQGDPGTTVFYLSLEDHLIRVYGASRMQNIFNVLKLPDEAPVDGNIVSKSISNSQKLIEGNNYGSRKAVIDFDNIAAEQMFSLYKERDHLLQASSIHVSVIENIEAVINKIISDKYPSGAQATFREVIDNISAIFPRITFADYYTEDKIYFPISDIKTKLIDAAIKYYNNKASALSIPDVICEVEKQFLLASIDRHWRSHLEDLSVLKDGTSFSTLAHKDPATQYKIDAYKLYDTMIYKIWEEAISRLFKARIRISETVDDNGELVYQHSIENEGIKNKKIAINL